MSSAVVLRLLAAEVPPTRRQAGILALPSPLVLYLMPMLPFSAHKTKGYR